MEHKSILILTADVGHRHRGAATAIEKAFELRYGSQAEVVIANPLDDPKAPQALRSVENDYDIVAKRLPEFYKLGYRMKDLGMVTSASEMAHVVFTYGIIARLMRQHQPDVVVVTYPIYQYSLWAYRRLNPDMKPVATIVTDLASLSRLWFDKEVNLCLVPTQTAADMALERGFAADRVQFTGLPVNPVLADTPESKSELRVRLGWDPELFTVLAAGDNRVEGLDRFVDVLNHAGFSYQIAAVAGGNDELYETWQATEWHVLAHVYNLAPDMSDFLQAADCVLSKAGGLIVSESLANGLPMFIMHVIPGEEMGNAQLVIGGKAGDIVLEPLELLEAMAHWQADNGRLYHERADNARRLGRPRAAYDAADLIWKLAESGL